MRKLGIAQLLVLCTIFGAAPAAAAPSGRLVGKPPSGPAPGASGSSDVQYYVVFVPRGAIGDLVARDGAGDTIGRARVDLLARGDE